VDIDHSTDTITADQLTDPLRIGGVAGLVLPAGTTAERIAADGLFRKNSTTGEMEYYNSTYSRWTSLDDIYDLNRAVKGFLLIDLTGLSTYSMSADESKYSMIVLSLDPVLAATVTLHDDVENPALYTILICGPQDTTLSCCSGSMDLILKGDVTSTIGYGFGLGAAVVLNYSAVQQILNDDPTYGPGSYGPSGRGDDVNRAFYRLQNRSNIIDRNTKNAVVIDMLDADYYMNGLESQYGNLLILNGGDGTKKLYVADSLNNPGMYNIYAYTVNPFIFTNVGNTTGGEISTLKLESAMYAWDGVVNSSIIIQRPTTAEVDPSTDRNYVNDVELAALGGVMGDAVLPITSSIDFGNSAYSKSITIADTTAVATDMLLLSIVDGGTMSAEEAAIQGVTLSSKTTAGVGFTIYAGAPNGARGILKVISRRAAGVNLPSAAVRKQVLTPQRYYGMTGDSFQSAIVNPTGGADGDMGWNTNTNHVFTKKSGLWTDTGIAPTGYPNAVTKTYTFNHGLTVIPTDVSFIMKKVSTDHRDAVTSAYVAGYSSGQVILMPNNAAVYDPTNNVTYGHSIQLTSTTVILSVDADQGMGLHDWANNGAGKFENHNWEIQMTVTG